jgi:hypothetical protein
MGPDGKKQLQSPDREERERQEHEARLATSARLVAEMQALMEQTKQRLEEHAAIMREIAKARRKRRDR